MSFTQSQGLGHEALTMAIAIVEERIRRLPKDDKDDLFKLVVELLNGPDPEELESIVISMREILEQAPIRVQEMDTGGECQPGDGLQKWMDYVSGKIKTLRLEAGLTQEELAKKSGLPQSHISRLEKAKHSPSRSTLEKIAAALGVEVVEFDPSA